MNMKDRQRNNKIMYLLNLFLRSLIDGTAYYLIVVFDVIYPKNAFIKMLMLRKNLFFDTLVNFQLIVGEIFLWKTAERYFNQIIELNKLLNNVCIFWVYSNKGYVLSS